MYEIPPSGGGAWQSASAGLCWVTEKSGDAAAPLGEFRIEQLGGVVRKHLETQGRGCRGASNLQPNLCSVSHSAPSLLEASPRLFPPVCVMGRNRGG